MAILMVVVEPKIFINGVVCEAQRNARVGSSLKPRPGAIAAHVQTMLDHYHPLTPVRVIISSAGQPTA